MRRGILNRLVRQRRETRRSSQRRNFQSGRTWVTLAPQYQTRGGFPTASSGDLSGYRQRIRDVIGEGGLDEDATDAEVGFFPCSRDDRTRLRGFPRDGSPKYSNPVPEVRRGDFPALAPHSRVCRKALRTRARRVDGRETGQTFLRPGRGACTALWWLDFENNQEVPRNRQNPDQLFQSPATPHPRCHYRGFLHFSLRQRSAPALNQIFGRQDPIRGLWR